MTLRLTLAAATFATLSGAAVAQTAPTPPAAPNMAPVSISMPAMPAFNMISPSTSHPEWRRPTPLTTSATEATSQTAPATPAVSATTPVSVSTASPSQPLVEDSRSLEDYLKGQSAPPQEDDEAMAKISAEPQAGPTDVYNDAIPSAEDMPEDPMDIVPPAKLQ